MKVFVTRKGNIHPYGVTRRGVRRFGTGGRMTRNQFQQIGARNMAKPKAGTFVGSRFTSDQHVAFNAWCEAHGYNAAQAIRVALAALIEGFEDVEISAGRPKNIGGDNPDEPIDN